MMPLYSYTIRTAAEEFQDITPQVQKAVRESGIKEGICVVFCPHTTGGITINADTFIVDCQAKFDSEGYLASENGITGAIKLYAVVSLLWAGVLLFVTAYTCGLYRGILALVKEGRPFDKGVVTNLRKVAWAILAGGTAATLLGLVGRVILTRAYPMEQIFASEAVTKLEYVFTMDFSFVATACIVFLLSYIFDYGQVLQRQSDETL